MKIFFLFVFVVFSIAISAQRVVDVTQDYSGPARGFYFTAGGEPFSNEKYVRVVAGSPYFNENWLWGSVIMPNGNRYDSLRLKLDLLASELHFINISGQDFITSSPVAEVLLKDSVSGKELRFIHSSVIASPSVPVSGWY